MSEKDIRDMRKLDELAEKAGGFVAMPNSAEQSKKFEEDFSVMRKYCIRHNIPFSELTAKDYDAMGIRPF